MLYKYFCFIKCIKQTGIKLHISKQHFYIIDVFDRLQSKDSAKMKYCNIHCGSSKKGDIKVLPGSGAGTLEPRSQELWEHGVCVLIEKDFNWNLSWCLALILLKITNGSETAVFFLSSIIIYKILRLLAQNEGWERNSRNGKRVK